MSGNKHYLIPETIQETLEMAKAAKGDFKYLAGATDVLANHYQDIETSKNLIDISKINALKIINRKNKYLKIGALSLLDDLQKSPEIVLEFPALIEAANAVGSPLIRKSATIGGNILCENRCIFYNQSEWWRESIGSCLKDNGEICIATGGRKNCYSEMVSDTAPVLISMNAQIELMDLDGLHIVDLEDIYTGDGLRPRNISETALLTAILLPVDQNFQTIFKKLRLRESLDFTSLTTAVTTDKNNNLNIAISGIDPKVVVVRGTMDEDKGMFVRKALKGARAVDNDMFSRNYRRKMIEIYLNQSFAKLEELESLPR